MAQGAPGSGESILRLANLALAFLLTGATAALAQQFPPQPAAPQMGSETQRAACRPEA